MRWTIEEHINKNDRSPRITFLEAPSNVDRSWGTRDVRWDGRIAMVARLRIHGPFARLLTQANDPPLVVGELQLLFAKCPAVA